MQTGKTHSMIGDFSKRLAAALAAAAMTVLGGCGSAEEKAIAYYQSGVEYLEKKDYAKAAIEFRNALKLKKDYADAWFGMAQIEEQAQAWPRVYGDLGKVLEIDPKHTKALVAIAKLQLLSGDFATALKNTNLVYELEPSNPDVIALKAAVLYKLNDKAGAVSEANKALKIKPNFADAIMLIASDQLESGDAAGALVAAENALMVNPQSLGLHLLRLRIFEKTGDLQKQEDALRQLTLTFPDHQSFQKGLIGFLVKNGRQEEAEKEMRAIVAAQPDNIEAGLELVRFLGALKGAGAAREEIIRLANGSKTPFTYQLNLSRLDFDAKRHEDAISLLRELVKQHDISDNGVAARLDLGAMLLATKRFDEAEAVVAEVLANDARNVGALKLRGALKIQRRNFEDAINDLREALNLDAKDASIRMALSSAYEGSGALELAGSELSEAVKISNYEPRVGIAYARYLMRHGRVDRAEDLMVEIASRSPRNIDVLSLLGELRLKKKDWKGAEETAAAVREQTGGAALSDQLMGASLMGQKRFEDAILFFGSTTQKTPDDIQPMFALVRAYVAAGKTAEAEIFMRSVLKADPDNSDAHVLMGSVQLALNKPDLAIASYETAVSQKPAAALGYQALSNYYVGQNQLNEAIKVLESGIEKVSDKSNLRLTLATVFENKGSFEDAIKQYELMIANDPGSFVAANNLASLLSDHRTDQPSLERAAALAAVLRDSPVPHFRETLGWVLVKKGDAKAGIAILEQTIEALGGLYSAQYHLGVAYSAAGDKKLAIKHLQLAQKLAKSPEEKAAILNAVSKLDPAFQP